MRWFPSPPPFQHEGQLTLRYEDVTQDGRMILHPMPTAIGHIAWPGLLKHMGATLPTRTMDSAVPILTRLVIDAGDGPLSVFEPLSGSSTHALAHVLNEAGEVERIYLNLWVALRGKRGNTHGFPVEHAGTPVAVGRVFAEHVFTRLFASPEQRKVRRLDLPGIAHPPGDAYLARSGAEVVAMDDGATLLGEEKSTLYFGVAHTDSNQHVNSLVYPRYFEDAALRLLQKPLLGRYIEVLFRKPFFAGQSAELTVRAYARAGEHWVVGTFAGAGKPHAYCRLLLA